MKTILHYSTFVTLSVHALGMVADLDMGCKPLSEIVDYVECIFNDATLFHGESVERVFASDSKTGELIAEFVNDKNDSFDDSDWDYDWNYDEDMGFDPYEGGYTYDC